VLLNIGYEKPTVPFKCWVASLWRWSHPLAETRGAIKLATQDEATIGKIGLAIRLTKAGEAPIFGHVLPLTGSELRTRLQPAAVAAIFIGVSPSNQDAANAAAAAFNLTPTETRVLANLLGGRTLAETAATLGIAPTTGKSHLENIFAKTGVARQADLMRLATGLTPPTSPGASRGTSCTSCG